MNDFEDRFQAADEQHRDRARAAARRRAVAERRIASIEARPDRVGLWAFLMALAVTVAAAASASAGSGGIGTPDAPKPDRKGMEREIATWYGPGLWGNQTACGQTLDRKTVGVAHKHLPCGTKVTFAYRGNTLTTKVIDRGPFANDATWDLTQAAAKQLEFETTDEIRFSVDSAKKR